MARRAAMPNAQDHALLDLLRRRRLLAPAELVRVGALTAGTEGTGAPLAHLLLAHGLLEGRRVAALLRELAQGSFACDRCAERLPYFSLADLPELACPLCGGALLHMGNPLARATAAAAPTERLSSTGARRARGGGGEVGAVGTISVRTAFNQRLSGAPAEPSLPRRLGRYLLTRELGRGANGVVYEARRSGGPEAYALKLLGRSADAEDVARFRQEALVARRLRHPGIVPVLDAGHVEGRYFYAMELCPGQTLRERLDRSGALPPAEAQATVRALAEAVQAAHDQGVLHRDLKPANVLVDARSGLVRVTDFGLARDLGRAVGLTRTGDVLGTPCYMAPEQFEGASLDPRTDVYALGVILYECLTARRPYEAPTLLALIKRIGDAEPPPPSRYLPVPARLERVCLQAFAACPDERYPSCRDLAEALR